MWLKDTLPNLLGNTAPESETEKEKTYKVTVSESELFENGGTDAVQSASEGLFSEETGKAVNVNVEANYTNQTNTDANPAPEGAQSAPVAPAAPVSEGVQQSSAENTPAAGQDISVEAGAAAQNVDNQVELTITVEVPQESTNVVTDVQQTTDNAPEHDGENGQDSPAPEITVNGTSAEEGQSQSSDSSDAPFEVTITDEYNSEESSADAANGTVEGRNQNPETSSSIEDTQSAEEMPVPEIQVETNTTVNGDTAAETSADTNVTDEGNTNVENPEGATTVNETDNDEVDVETLEGTGVTDGITTDDETQEDVPFAGNETDNQDIDVETLEGTGVADEGNTNIENPEGAITVNDNVNINDEVDVETLEDTGVIGTDNLVDTGVTTNDDETDVETLEGTGTTDITIPSAPDYNTFVEEESVSPQDAPASYYVPEYTPDDSYAYEPQIQYIYENESETSYVPDTYASQDYEEETVPSPDIVSPADNEEEPGSVLDDSQREAETDIDVVIPEDPAEEDIEPEVIELTALEKIEQNDVVDSEMACVIATDMFDIQLSSADVAQVEGMTATKAIDALQEAYKTELFSNAIYSTKISTRTDSATIDENREAIADFLKSYNAVGETINSQDLMYVDHNEQSVYKAAGLVAKRILKGEYVMTKDLQKYTKMLDNIEEKSERAKGEKLTEDDLAAFDMKSRGLKK